MIGFLNKLFKNNWTITLVATTLGVYLGVYINNYNTKHTEEQKAGSAFEDVLNELKDNQELLVEWDSISRQNYQFFERYNQYAQEEEDGLIMSIAEMQTFRTQFADVLTIEDSTLIQKDTFLYDATGELNFENQLVFNLQYEIAWSAIKNTEYLRYINFDCIKSIELFYNLLAISNTQRKKWIDKIMAGEVEDNESRMEILNNWQAENDINSKILNLFPQLEENLKECLP